MSPDVRASGARRRAQSKAGCGGAIVVRRGKEMLRAPHRVQHRALLERLVVLLRLEGWCRGSSGTVTQLAVHGDARVHERVRGCVDHVLATSEACLWWLRLRRGCSSGRDDAAGGRR